MIPGAEESRPFWSDIWDIDGKNRLVAEGEE